MSINSLKKVILLIDDNPGEHILITHAIENAKPAFNFEIITANNSDEGYAQLQSLLINDNLPSLIILDINLPRLDGIEFFDIIKKNHTFSKIPIVFFSTSKFSIDKLISLGHIAFPKPHSLKEYEIVIPKILNFL